MSLLGNGTWVNMSLLSDTVLCCLAVIFAVFVIVHTYDHDSHTEVTEITNIIECKAMSLEDRLTMFEVCAASTSWNDETERCRKNILYGDLCG